MLQATTNFTTLLKKNQLTIQRNQLETLQVNIGKRCNQACHHCHVESGPNRTENMEKPTVDRLLALLAGSPMIHTVDITGGAPELNPNFRYFVTQIKKLGKSVIDRCNLTVLLEPGQADTAEFLSKHQVQIVSSLPCYSQKNVDKQRGKGVFAKSIKVLQDLNRLGYGKEQSGLILNLVYNPVGAFLPPKQSTLEQEYKQLLKQNFNIEFNQLLTITNMPINRYKHFLELTGEMDAYMQLLIDNFNPDAVGQLMCRHLISIGWDGKIYDCDFNQMLDLLVKDRKQDIWAIDSFDELTTDIALGNHCYGCSAGSGSSCSGALT